MHAIRDTLSFCIACLCKMATRRVLKPWSHVRHVFSNVERLIYTLYITVKTSDASQIKLSKLDRSLICMFTVYNAIHLLTLSARIPSIDGATIPILKIRKMVTW